MQVFKAIDQNKQGEGYSFTFHPDAKETAQEHIAGLYLKGSDGRGFGPSTLYQKKSKEDKN
jgi:hypothetical protein